MGCTSFRLQESLRKVQKKVTVVSLARDMPTGPYLCLYQIIKIFQTIKKLWSAQELGLEIHLGEIRKRTEQDLFFLHATLPLDQISICTY